MKAPIKTHTLKTWPQYFAAVKSLEKQFEVREANRDFRVGDRLELAEYDPERGCFTSADSLTRYISYILPDKVTWCDKECVVLGLSVVPVEIVEI